MRRGAAGRASVAPPDRRAAAIKRAAPQGDRDQRADPCHDRRRVVRRRSARRPGARDPGERPLGDRRSSRTRPGHSARRVDSPHARDRADRAVTDAARRRRPTGPDVPEPSPVSPGLQRGRQADRVSSLSGTSRRRPVAVLQEAVRWPSRGPRRPGRRRIHLPPDERPHIVGAGRRRRDVHRHVDGGLRDAELLRRDGHSDHARAHVHRARRRERAAGGDRQRGAGPPWMAARRRARRAHRGRVGRTARQEGNRRGDARHADDRERSHAAAGALCSVSAGHGHLGERDHPRDQPARSAAGLVHPGRRGGSRRDAGADR